VGDEALVDGALITRSASDAAATSERTASEERDSLLADRAGKRNEYGITKVRHTVIGKFIFLPSWRAKVGYCDEGQGQSAKIKPKYCRRRSRDFQVRVVDAWVTCGR
jgi:hypothetical protein